MKKTILSLLIVLVTGYSGMAQSNNDTNEISQYLMKFDLNKLKDSIAMYSFAFKVDIENDSEHIKISKIEVNDSLAYSLYKDFDFLKRVDYKTLLGKSKKSSVIFPVMIVLVGYSENDKPKQQVLPLSNIYGIKRTIEQLFYENKNAGDYIYYRPTALFIDKTKYY